MWQGGGGKNSLKIPTSTLLIIVLYTPDRSGMKNKNMKNKKCERCKEKEVTQYFPMADLCNQCRYDWWNSKFTIKLGKIIEKKP